MTTVYANIISNSLPSDLKEQREQGKGGKQEEKETFIDDDEKKIFHGDFLLPTSMKVEDLRSESEF